MKSFVTRCALAAMVFAATAPGAARADVDLWPLYESSDDSLTVMYPLFVKERDFQMMFPFYYRTNEGKDHHVLWPLVKVSQEQGLVRLAPIYFVGEESEVTVFPFYHRSPDRTITLLPPRYVTRDDDFEVIVPVYAYAHEKDAYGEYESTHWLWPIYQRSSERDLQGRLVEQSRRFLLFSDVREASGKRRFEILGIPISERY